MTIATDIQSLYIAYFNRPADYLGLKYWTAQAQANGGSVAAVANAFSASPEYTTQFAGQSSAQIINTIYMNLFGRPAEPAAIDYWGTRLDNKVFNIGTIATSILQGAQNLDKTTIQNKVAAAEAFYAAMDTSVEITGYDGPAANAVVKTWLSTVTSDAASLTAATDAAALNTVLANAAAAHDNTTGTNFTLTAGTDNIVGTAGNDVFTVAGTNPTTGAALTVAQSFDVVTGGAGTDTINWYAATGSNEAITGTFTGIEIANFYGADKITGGIDASKIGGLQQAWLQANATAVNVSGLSGKTVGVAGASAGVTANFGATATAAAVALKGATDAAGTGNASVTLVGAGLTSATVSGSGKATLVSAETTLKTLNVKADSATTLNVAGATALTAIDASGSAGDVTLVGNLAAVASIKGGAGADTVTTLATTKQTIDLGAGNDSLTIGANVLTGSTINLGAGNDSVGGSGVVAAGATIDGGAGTDTFGLSVIDASNAGSFVNFEVASLDALAAATYDLDLLASKNTLTGLSLTAGGSNVATVNNIAQASTVTVNGGTTTGLTLGVKGAAAATTDTITVSFAAKAAASVGVTINEVETVNVVSAGDKGVANTFNLTSTTFTNATASANATEKVVVTGANDLNLSVAGATAANTKVVVDASAATGKVAVTGGVSTTTITTGAGDDTITVAATATTVTTGAGKDIVNVTAATGATNVTTIASLAAGDSLTTAAAAATAGKIGVATSLTGATDLPSILGKLFAAANDAANTTHAAWATVGTDVYLVVDGGAALADSNVVKLTGVTTLADWTVDATGHITVA